MTRFVRDEERPDLSPVDTRRRAGEDDDMSGAAVSLVSWGVYALLAGLALLVASDTVLPLLGFLPSEEHWVSVIALLMMGLGLYYVVLAVTETRHFFVVSALGRAMFFVASTLLILLGKAPVALLTFGLVDLFSAVWTAIALRRDGRTLEPAGVPAGAPDGRPRTLRGRDADARRGRDAPLVRPAPSSTRRS